MPSLCYVLSILPAQALLLPALVQQRVCGGHFGGCFANQRVGVGVEQGGSPPPPPPPAPLPPRASASLPPACCCCCSVVDSTRSAIATACGLAAARGWLGYGHALH